MLRYDRSDDLFYLFAGIHRVQEVSGNKRHTSVVTVSVLEDTYLQYQVHQKDVVFTEFRASGAGGQHRNKVSTAIRAIHQPTGIAVVSSDSKSQHTNKMNALQKIVDIIQQQMVEQAQQQRNDKRVAQIGTQSRSEKSWNWTAWRDQVDIPGYGTYSMKNVLKSKFPF